MGNPQPQTLTPQGWSTGGQGQPDPAPTSPKTGTPAPSGGSKQSSGELMAKAKKYAESPILPIALMAIAGYLTWFGVHYWRTDTKWPTDPIKALLRGQQIPAATIVGSATTEAVAGLFQSAPAGGIVGTGSGIANLGPGANADIAADGLKYVGSGYQFGGHADAIGNWDCSSFLFYVLAHDLGLSVLGGRWGDPGYPPHAHGPTAVQYKMFGVGVSEPAAGDIVAWNTHCGIALDANRIVAARTPSEGTGISTISGTSRSINEVPVFRRVKIGV